MRGFRRFAWVLVSLLSTAGCQRCGGAGIAGTTDAGAVVTLPPEPVVLADAQPGPSAIVADDAFLYWNHAGAGLIAKMPKGGGPVTKLYASGSEAGGHSIALDRDAVYFDEAWDVKRVPKAGGPATTIGRVPQLPAYLAADDDGVYAIADTVLGFAKDGSGTRVVSTAGETWAIATDATHVYWVARGAVRRAPKGSGPVETLAEGTFRFSKMALSDAEVFWGDGVLEAIFAVPKNGGRPRFIAHAWSIGSKRLAVDARGLWALQSGGRLDRIDPATGVVTTIALGLDRGGSSDHYFGLAIAGDDAFVAAGGASTFGGSLKPIDLTGKTKPVFPTMTFGGQVLRVSTATPAGALTSNERVLEVARVWFDKNAVVAQDIGNATRWIDQLEEVVVPDVKAGRLGLALVAFTGEGATTEIARARASAVESAIRGKLGAAARITTSTPSSSGYHGDVQVALDPDDLGTLLTPPPPPARRGRDASR